LKVDIGSDQTSLHNPWAGGYYPAGISLEESNVMMQKKPEQFKTEVRKPGASYKCGECSCH